MANSCTTYLHFQKILSGHSFTCFLKICSKAKNKIITKVLFHKTLLEITAEAVESGRDYMSFKSLHLPLTYTAVHSAQCTVHSAQFTVHSSQFTKVLRSAALKPSS